MKISRKASSPTNPVPMVRQKPWPPLSRSPAQSPRLTRTKPSGVAPSGIPAAAGTGRRVEVLGLVLLRSAEGRDPRAAAAISAALAWRRGGGAHPPEVALRGQFTRDQFTVIGLQCLGHGRRDASIVLVAAGLRPGYRPAPTVPRNFVRVAAVDVVRATISKTRSWRQPLGVSPPFHGGRPAVSSFAVLMGQARRIALNWVDSLSAPGAPAQIRPRIWASRRSTSLAPASTAATPGWLKMA